MASLKEEGMQAPGAKGEDSGKQASEHDDGRGVADAFDEAGDVAAINKPRRRRKTAGEVDAACHDADAIEAVAVEHTEECGVGGAVGEAGEVAADRPRKKKKRNRDVDAACQAADEVEAAAVGRTEGRIDGDGMGEAVEVSAGRPRKRKKRNKDADVACYMADEAEVTAVGHTEERADGEAVGETGEVATDRPKKKKMKNRDADAGCRDSTIVDGSAPLARSDEDTAEVQSAADGGTTKPSKNDRQTKDGNVAGTDGGPDCDGTQAEAVDAHEKARKKKRKAARDDEGDVPVAADADGAAQGEVQKDPQPEEATETRVKKKRRKNQEFEAGETMESANALPEEHPVAGDGVRAAGKKKKTALLNKTDAGAPAHGDAAKPPLLSQGGADDDAVVKKPKEVPAQKSETATDAVATPSSSGDAGECLKICAANLDTSLDKAAIWEHFEKCGPVRDVFLIKDRYTWQFHGIAFITYEDAKSVDAAIKLNGTDFSGRKVRVNVAFDRSYCGGEKATKGGGRGGGGQASGKCSGRGGAGKGQAWLAVQGGGTGSFGAKGKGQGTKAASKGDWRNCGKGTAPTTGAAALGAMPANCRGFVVKSLSFDVSEADLRETFGGLGGGLERVRLLVDKNTGLSKGKAFMDFKDEAGVKAAAELHGSKLKGRCLFMEYASQPRGGDGS